jgi:hypothetical protein
MFVCTTQNTRQIISVQYRNWNTNISVRFLRSSGMLRSYVGSSLPIFRDSLPVQSSRVRHSSWTERPDWVTLNFGKPSENTSCVKSHNSEGRKHTAAQASNLINCISMLNMYIFKTYIDVQHTLWEWSGCCMDSRGIAGRFPTEPRVFSTIVRIQAGCGETHMNFQWIFAGIISWIKRPVREAADST